MKPYQNNRPINRPTLKVPPWWPVDLQSLPPYRWCDCCGAEVYSPGEHLCLRCKPGKIER